MDIEISGLSKVYKGQARALDGLSLSISGGMVGLLGANGAGKTTLMRILTGILRPSSGSVVAGGHNLSTAGGRTAVKRVLGYLPQQVDLYPDLTGLEFLDYIALLKGMDDKRKRRAQCESLLERVALTDSANRRIGAYSGGMKRRIGIAQALLGDPRLIVVDEPTAGLDPEERMRFRTLLASLGGDRTVVLSTHILDDVSQTCPDVAVLTEGRLVYHGSTAGLVEAARDNVYLVDTPGPPPKGNLAVVNAQASPTGTLYRVVTEETPAGARPTEPTLEDGYVALMRLTRAHSLEAGKS
jgi:ABC-type multidrug transport system ATPase subunit